LASAGVRPAVWRDLTTRVLTIDLADPASAIQSVYAVRHDAALAAVQVWAASGLAGLIGVFAILAAWTTSSSDQWYWAIGLSMLFVGTCAIGAGVARRELRVVQTALESSLEAVAQL